jgi:hypothetical protein
MPKMCFSDSNGIVSPLHMAARASFDEKSALQTNCRILKQHEELAPKANGLTQVNTRRLPGFARPSMHCMVS